MTTEIVILVGILQAIALPVLAYVARKTIDNGELLAKLAEQLRSNGSEMHDIRTMITRIDDRVHALELENAKKNAE
jgi:hypothetical protein